MNWFIRVGLVMLAAVTAQAAQADTPPVTGKDLSRALSQLDKQLARRQAYIVKHTEITDSLRAALETTDSIGERLRLMLSLGDTYNSLNIDSALWFYGRGYNEALDAGFPEEMTRFKLRQATFLPLLGFFSAADSIFDVVHEAGVSTEMMPEFLDAERQALFYTSTSFHDYPHVRQYYLNRSLEAQEALLEHLEEGSPRYKLNYAETLFYHQQLARAKETLEELVSEIGDTHPLYARATHLLADIAKQEGDMLTRTYFLALSATADVKCATLEVASLQELGRLLFEDGDVNRAHNYMNVALENAVECHVPLRMIEAARMLPLVHKAHAIREKRLIWMLSVALLVAIVAIAVAGAAFVMERREQRRLSILTQRLDEAGRLKDSYISQFLKLCSIYMEKLTSFNRVVHGKLIAGKSDDLIKLTKTGKMVEELSAEFYDIFDDAILGLYPSFVSEVNALLQPDGQISLKEGERMNVELRILALLRLGITDATHIARMLNYSVNTIYTYRNKLKNRALDRDNFETQVMEIK